MDRLDAMAVFVRVARRSSFSEAARELRQSATAVSRKVAELEDHLGVRLLRRTTRKVTVTDAGLAYLSRCEQLLADLEATEMAAREQHGRPRGHLRATVGVSFAEEHVLPLLPGFLAAYPDIELDLVLTDRHVDLVGEGVDVALRIGSLGDSSLLARRLATIRHVVCASPAYLEQHGAPQSPEALRDHACLLDTNQPRDWHLDSERGSTHVQVTGPLRVNSAHAVRRAALAGLGIGYMPTFVCGADLVRGALVQVLPGHRATTAALHAVFPTGRRVSAKVQAFVDHMRASLGERPPWDAWLDPAPSAAGKKPGKQ
ncbi:Transcriptional regulator, LysR family protein [Minicystis rosea]|nr:Transcriptional regulator, LysR family protein [Minicystis rosea]